MSELQPGSKSDRHPVLRFIFTIITLILGMVIGYFVGSLRTAQPHRGTVKEILEPLTFDTLVKVSSTADSLMAVKNKSLLDSVNALRGIKDTLFKVTGVILAAKEVAHEQKNMDEYIQLDALNLNIENLIDTLNIAIENLSLEYLQPVNTGFTSLIHDIKDKTDQLKGEADTIGTIATITSILGNLLSLPLLGGSGVAATAK